MDTRADAAGTGRLAIRCIRIDLIDADERERVELEMRELGERLGYPVHDEVIELNPHREGIYTTVMLALRRTGATTIIVRDLQDLDRADHGIREHAQIITVAGERVLGRAFMRPSEAL